MRNKHNLLLIGHSFSYEVNNDIVILNLMMDKIIKTLNENNIKTNIFHCKIEKNKKQSHYISFNKSKFTSFATFGFNIQKKLR
jgi:GTP-sensing pleiotropic transcriptional regulator CodY